MTLDNIFIDLFDSHFQLVDSYINLRKYWRIDLTRSKIVLIELKNLIKANQLHTSNIIF